MAAYFLSDVSGFMYFFLAYVSSKCPILTTPARSARLTVLIVCLVLIVWPYSVLSEAKLPFTWQRLAQIKILTWLNIDILQWMETSSFLSFFLKRSSWRSATVKCKVHVVKWQSRSPFFCIDVAPHRQSAVIPQCIPGSTFGPALICEFFCFSRNVTNECSWRYSWPFFKLISCKSPQKKQVFTHSNYEECGRYRVPGQEVRAYSTDYQCAPIGIFMTHIHYLDFFAIHIQYTLRTDPLWMLRDRCVAFKSQKHGMQPLPAERSHTYLRIYVPNSHIISPQHVEPTTHWKFNKKTRQR